MSAKGTSSFIAMRASSVLLLPLAAWFVWSVAKHGLADYETARDWAARPRNAGLGALFIALSAFHMRIGLQEVIEDYVHDGFKGGLAALNWIAAIAVAIAGGFAAWRLAF